MFKDYLRPKLYLMKEFGSSQAKLQMPISKAKSQLEAPSKPNYVF
jgi:hypothetical protein